MYKPAIYRDFWRDVVVDENLIEFVKSEVERQIV